MPQKPRKPKKPKKTYDWFFTDDKETKVVCFASNVSNCTVKARLLEADRSNFHDAELQSATREINDILDRIERNSKDVSRHLCFIDVRNRFMLVWSNEAEGISKDNDPEVARFLKIKDSPDETRIARRKDRT